MPVIQPPRASAKDWPVFVFQQLMPSCVEWQAKSLLVAAAPYARALPPPGTALSQDWPALAFVALRTPT